MTYEVRQVDKLFLVLRDRKWIGTYNTHAQAWKAIDRLEGEPVNKSEQRAHWFEKKTLDQ